MVKIIVVSVKLMSTCARPRARGGGGNAGADPRVQAAGQLGNAVGNAIGQAIGKALFGDPQARRDEALSLNDQGVRYYKDGQVCPAGIILPQSVRPGQPSL